jgi:hypothetical protein
MESYCEIKFFNDFITYYEHIHEYDLSLSFDEFYHDFKTRNSPDFLKSIYLYYYNIDDFDEEHKEEILHETLYSQIEKHFLLKCESEADTEVDTEVDTDVDTDTDE